MTGVALWGGVECTINRVGDVWQDQLADTGHRERLDDLDRFAELGIKALRHPVLWERHAEEGGGDWRWADQSLARLRALGIEPIVGLLHHGSGPPGTSLVDPGFAEGLAAHAARVARRYPWVLSYTPVNEPLTTARFSTLYGLWYPHARDDRLFARAIVNQCRAVVLAMREIRLVNPEARLVQTEDLGHIHSTPLLRYQADWENERRWMTWDLLCGRVSPDLPVIRFLRGAGIPAAELDWFGENACPPALIGINHYVTSDRFLDHRLDRYPGVSAGGNGRHRYVDVEAVRVLPELHDGWRRSLEEAWARYGLPIAITEAHLGCTRDEQLRWLADAWTAAQEARADGRDVRAVTAWALLGSRDWNSLLTRWVDHYEPGAFDLREGTPRPTALATAIRELAAGAKAPSHPVVQGEGWWHRPIRLLPGLSPAVAGPEVTPRRSRQRPLLITGAGGNLGRALAFICELRGLEYRLCTRRELDICTPGDVDRLLKGLQPWAVINTAGYVRVDEAECEQERCYRENTEGPRQLAAAAARHGIRFVTFSSDLVFDGSSQAPYVESSRVGPLNVYGDSKARAEREVLRENPDALVVRTSSFFGPWHPHDFLTVALRALGRGEPFAAMHDVIVSPTYVPDLANACLDLVVDGEHGIWHLANRGSVSWLELARLGAQVAGVDAASLVPRSCAEFGLAARRPAFSALSTERSIRMPDLEDAIGRYARDGRPLWSCAA